MWYHQETSPLQKNLPRTTANSSNAYNTIARHTLHHSYEPATSIKNKENCQSSINQSREYTNHWKHSLGNQPTLYYLLPHLTKPMCIFLIPNLIQNTEKTRSVKVPINQCMTMVHEKKKKVQFLLTKTQQFPLYNHCHTLLSHRAQNKSHSMYFQFNQSVKCLSKVTMYLQHKWFKSNLRNNEVNLPPAEETKATKAIWSDGLH